jgi:glycosyltransferase involved in cell wall biosynthesis
MNILSLNYEFPPLGGGGGYVTKIVNEMLVRRGASVDLVTMHYGDLPMEETLNGVRIFRSRSLRRKQETCETIEMLTYVASGTARALQLSKQKRYDIVHAHFAIPTGLIAYALQKLRRLNYIITVHGSDIPGYNPDRFTVEHRFTRPLLVKLMKNARVTVALSDYLKTLIQANVSADVPLTVIPNGIESDKFRVDQERNNWILMSGRLLPRKGFHHVLEVLKTTPLPGWECHIAGDGPYRAQLEAMAQQTSNTVVFHGWLSKDSTALRELYERSRIFILPSEAENAPIALLEAMNAGLGIITTNATGCREIAGDTTLLVSPGDVAGIKKAILDLVGQDSLAASLGAKARARSLHEFSWEAIVDTYSELYQRYKGSAPP